MEIFFFTTVDAEPNYREQAEWLLASGEKYGRKIHLFDMPSNKRWRTYKIDIMGGDLPAADKYVYIDADAILTCRGDWELDECEGMSDPLHFYPKLRAKYTVSFMRNHTVTIGEGKGFEYIHSLWIERGEPVWVNNGVVVLKGADRLPFTHLWRQWTDRIDAACEKPPMQCNEPASMFAAAEYGLPLLPPRFNGLCKSQPIPPDGGDCVLIHADGNVTGQKRKPYDNAVARVIDG